ncbi:MAG: DUF58 domain-containing protein [Clostridia bacterium]|nr:DUF58 domain-containing protein [Clostridia bacterium]
MTHAGSYTEISLPVMIAGIVFAAIILISVIGWFVYRELCKSIIDRLEYRRSFSEDGVYEGDCVTLTERIYNPTRLPLMRAYAESYFFPQLDLGAPKGKDKSAMQRFESRFSFILPYMEIKRKHTVTCTKRGVYKLETAIIHLPGTQRTIESASTLYVYPRILATPTYPNPVGVLMGESVSKRMLIKDPFSVIGVRPYTFGDPFNQINFKQTAKAYAQAAQPLRVNALDYCSNRTFMIFINFATDPEEPIPSAQFNTMMENAMSYTADIIRIMSENGYRLGLYTNSTQNNSNEGLCFPMRSGDIHARDMLQGMSRVRIAASYSFTTLLARVIESGLCDTEIFVFSAYTDPEIEAHLEALKRNRNSVNFIVPLAEEAEK